MQVNLGTIEVNDDIRRAINARFGKSGLATRRLVRECYRSLADADLDVIVADWAKDQVTPVGPQPVSAFKDEAGYTITYNDGSFEESPVKTLAHLRETAKYWKCVLVRENGSWIFRTRLTAQSPSARS